MAESNFSVFSRSAPTPRYTILDSRFPPVMWSREAGLPSATRARKRELPIQEVRLENDSDRKFSKSKFFLSFSENHFFPRFRLPCLLLAENIFSVFRSPHLPLDTQFWLLIWLLSIVHYLLVSIRPLNYSNSGYERSVPICTEQLTWKLQKRTNFYKAQNIRPTKRNKQQCFIRVLNFSSKATIIHKCYNKFILSDETNCSLNSMPDDIICFYKMYPKWLVTSNNALISAGRWQLT